MRENIKNAIIAVKKLLYILNKQQKRYGILMIIASLIGAILETVGVSAIIPLINALLTPEVLLENDFLSNIFAYFNILNTNEIVFVVAMATILLYVFKNIYFIVLSWMRAKYAGKIKRELSVHMMKVYMDKGYPFFLSRNTSELLRGVINDANGVYVILNQVLRMIVDVMTICMICIYILLTDFMLAWIMVALAGFCLILLLGFFKGKMQKYGQESRKYMTLVSQQAMQAMQGIKEVIVTRKQKYFIENFEKAYIKQQKADVGQSVGAESPGYVIEAICIMGLLSMICIRIMTGSVDAEAMLPTLSAFVVGAFRILPALGKISSGFNTMIFYVPGLNDMYRHMKEAETNQENLSAIYENQESDFENIRFANELKIEKVCWKYSEESDYVLNNLDLTIKKGESIALIGHSGAGKTTLADIILGLLKPQLGCVTLDGRDIFSIGREWGSIIAYVPQVVFLTDDSIRKNIAFGIDEKDIDDEKVWRALEQAQLKEFVEGLDNKLDTKVGERGVRFSGGQRQRVAIARALYENPDILVLDEATAALDNETESAVMESIEALQGKITLIIIAHRLTTVKKCDKIYEIKDGIAVERKKTEIYSQ